MHKEGSFFDQNKDHNDIVDAWVALTKNRLVELENGIVKGRLWQDIKNEWEQQRGQEQQRGLEQRGQV